jgi:hypothetical protein
MAVIIKGRTFDTMKEACNRLEISRPSMLRYLDQEFFTPPKIHRQGKGKAVRYFDDEWYTHNEPILARARAAAGGKREP